MQEYNEYQFSKVGNAPLYNADTPEQKEKAAIKKAAKVVGLSVLLMTFFSLFIGTAVTFIAGAFGLSKTEAQQLFLDPFASQIIQIVFSVFIFTVPFIVVFKIGGYNISETVPLDKPKKETVLPFILMGVGFCAFANLAVSFAGNIFASFGIDYEVDFGENPQGFLGFIISFIATAIIPALVEEFACRGLILGALKRFGNGFAIIASSIVFGLMHGNFEQMPFAFLVGLSLAFITIKSGSIWISAVVHLINNSISVLVDYALSAFSENMQNVIYYIYLALALSVGIIGFFIYTKKEEKPFSLGDANMVTSEGTKYKHFFLSPVMIIFAVICIIEAMLYF